MYTPLRHATRLALVLSPLILLLAFSVSASSAATTYSSHLRRYPYLTDVVNSYATINWGTDQSLSTGAARWGKVGSESCTAHYAPASRTVVNVNGVAEYQWKALLNLLPGTQYCYRVYLGSSPSTEIDLLGSDSTPAFWTQTPAGSSEPFSFVVFGDWGYVGSTGTNPYQARLMSLIASSGARFALTVGDNGYPAGSQANYGDLIQTGANLSAIFGPAFWKVPGSFTPIFAASGNHGISNTDPNHPLILNFPQDRAVASSSGRYIKETYCCLDGTTSANYPSAWYAFDAGLARIYMLDSAWSDSNVGNATAYKVDYDYKWTQSSLEYQWLKADLASHPSILKFAILHYPIYTDDPDVNQRSDTFLQGSNSLEGLLHQYGVDLAFTGHAHIYERNFASSVGLPNYVTGGGGAPSGTLGTCTALDAYAIKFTTTGKGCGSAPTPTSVDQLYHFLKVTINGTQVTVTPINSLGQKFDRLTYDFSAGSEANPPSAPTNLAATAPSGTQVDLTWSAASDDTGVRGYDLYRNGQLVYTTDAATLAYSDTGLTPFTDYTYTVDAFDASGNHSSLSAPASITTPRTATYIFTPVASAYVAADSTTTNFGLTGTLIQDSSPNYHSYLRFNVNGISGSLTSATLRLFSTSASSTGYQVRSVVPGSWEENQITYANAPGVGGLIGSSPGFSNAAWVNADVSSFVTGKGLYDLALTTTSASPISFASRNASANWPQLVIQTMVLPSAVFDVSPVSWDYGMVGTGATSAAQDFTITNLGGSALTIGTVTLAGAHPDQFQLIADNCSGSSVPATGTCTVTAAFAPTLTGSLTASINFPDNAGGPHSLTLSGTGAAEQTINGGFNVYSALTPMIPSKWKAGSFASTDGKSTSVKMEGTASIKISNTFALKKTLTQVRTISGAAGDTFQLKVWTRGQNIPTTPGVARVVVKLFNGAVLIQSNVMAFPTGTYGFKQNTITFTAIGPYTKLLVRLMYNKSSGKIWFDGLSLLKSP